MAFILGPIDIKQLRGGLFQACLFYFLEFKIDSSEFETGVIEYSGTKCSSRRGNGWINLDDTGISILCCTIKVLRTGRMLYFKSQQAGSDAGS